MSTDTAATSATTRAGDAGPHRVVVVGGGPAAHRLTDALHSRAGSATLRVDVVSEEPHLPYDRVALSTLLSGADDLTLSPTDIWAAEHVTLHRGVRATAIDRAARTVTTSSGEVLEYDDLVLATGSDAAVPPIPGAELGLVYRTIEDIDLLTAKIAQVAETEGRPADVVVVGGGLLGLEAAGGAKKLGARASIVHSGGWLMSAQLDEGAGRALGRIIGEQGITLRLGTRPAEVVGAAGSDPADKHVSTVLLQNGTSLAADVVVFAIGIRARDELARESGLTLGPRGGVEIGTDCRTSDPHVWAIGEVACFEGVCTGLVAPANAMAEVVADRLLGGGAEFTSVDDATKLKLSGVDVASFGDALAKTEHALEVVYADPARGMYQKLVVTGDAKTLLGGMFVGDASPYAGLRPLLGSTLSSEPAAYLSVSGVEAPDDELPDAALVCACNNVSAGDIRGHISGEATGEACTDLTSLKTCSRAGTQCGSCVPLVKKLLESELTKSGIEVSRAMCEHFAVSRAELFEQVQVLGLTSFDAIVARLGTGAGCDVCKPAVASILASQHDSYVLDAGRGALQDTNDRALANMQKDGTYSVVPRIPGGEITPEKLGVIADVAKKHQLYTKITGGQRIDLFGARLDQLPEIWRELVDAGFESGQAYGKSLRNVKSCVGSSWCRFGVQDSVSMAIRLELRYRGLRSPHKFKVGVSGCARECAEARGKDVGVIATENGWNLYVGGNGGFQPAHAQLLAADLDDETLVRYIDRYLMYYIRTADRLQRTARWMEDLDGGLDHVRDVVVDDSLGLAADLEAAMAAHVDRYEDEWAATLRDPERLARFRSFANADGAVVDTSDPSRLRVLERGQLRPATAAERESGHGILVTGATLPVRGRADG